MVRAAHLCFEVGGLSRLDAELVEALVSNTQGGEVVALPLQLRAAVHLVQAHRQLVAACKGARHQLQPVVCTFRAVSAQELKGLELCSLRIGAVSEM